jgi:hypothetical protein
MYGPDFFGEVVNFLGTRSGRRSLDGVLT